MGQSNRHRSPSDIRRRQARKATRAANPPVRQPNTFRYFVNRLDPKRSIFESPTAQQDLNEAICCSTYETAAMEHSRGRLSVMTWAAPHVAEELTRKGWVQE